MARRRYILTVLLTVGAAAVVVWQLGTARDTTCFWKSVDTDLAMNRRVAYLATNCGKSKSFATVRTHLEKNEEVPDGLGARSALIVWIALFVATAGFAAILGAQSVVIVRELSPPRDAAFVAGSILAAAVVALPFLVFRFASVFELSHFDDLHAAQLRWLNGLVGLLVIPGIIGLVAVGRVLSVRAVSLADAARVGSRLRLLVGMLGAVLSLSVLVTAARSQAIGKLPGGEALPSSIVLLWGSSFAIVLAAVYVPIHQRWAAETARLVSEEVSRQLPGKTLPGTPGFRAPELALKKELLSTLGVGGALKSLQGSVAVLAPVIAAAVSSLFA
jgi:hypothetical protein